MILEKENKWLKPRQISKIMNISVTTVFRMIKSGQLRAKRFGGSVRIESTEFIKSIKDY